MIKNKKLDNLIDALNESVYDLASSKNKIKMFQTLLYKKKMPVTKVNTFLNNPQQLLNEEEATILIFTQQLYQLTFNEEINPEKWFANQEIKGVTSYVYREVPKYTKKSFPLVLANAMKAYEDDSVTINMSARELGELKLNGLVNWNPLIQRDAKKVMSGGEIKEEPNIYQQNRTEIKKDILDGKLIKTVIVLNIPLNITGDVDGDYEFNRNKLVIKEGAHLDIVDGTHRIYAAADAILEDSDNEFLDKTRFLIEILNVSDDEAMRYQADLAKATPIPKSRLKELRKDTLADQVTDRLKLDSNSDLRNKVSANGHPKTAIGELVDYGTLSKSIELCYKKELNNRLDVSKVSDYLKEYFLYLFGEFGEYTNEQNNLLFRNKTFTLHIRMSKIMQDNSVPLYKLKVIINPETFYKDKVIEKNSKIYEAMSSVSFNRLNTKMLDQYADALDFNLKK